MTEVEFQPLRNAVREEIRAVLGFAPELPAFSVPFVPASEDPASLIDHTLLKPDATRAGILELCREAAQWKFASVCVNPCWVALAASELAGSPVKVCTVIGFPLGATLTEVKIFEATAAIGYGAQELDMVLNIGALRGREYQVVLDDIRGVAAAAHSGAAILKVILETALLDDTQKSIACVLAKIAGADFVKTSTGFGPSGATVHDIQLMRAFVGPAMGVKASGGIRDAAAFHAMIAAGATRVGASASVQIMQAAGSAATGY